MNVQSLKRKFFSTYTIIFHTLYIAIIICPSLLFSDDNGLVIAFAGLSGSGKSTIAKTMESLYTCNILIEPEESEWPETITKKEFGYFTMWMSFRQIWLPLQFQAQALKKKSKIVFLDSYFIKIIGYELEKSGMEWLFPKEDPYFAVYRQICQLDIQLLPDPDCIVLFDVSYNDWLKMLSSRNREWDKTPGFIESYDQTKSAIQESVLQLCKERNIRLIFFQPEFGDPIEQAKRLRSILIEEKIIILTRQPTLHR